MERIAEEDAMKTLTMVLVPDSDDSKKVEIDLDPKTFKSGTVGFYHREPTVIAGETYHVQVIISK